MNRALLMMAATATLWAVAAEAVPTPAQKCQAGKDAAAGTYAKCRQTAEKAFVLNGDATKYATAIAKCATTLAKAWQRLETAAASHGASCPDGLSLAEVQGAIDAQIGDIATALGGGGFAACTLDLLTCADNRSSTQASLDACTGDLASCNSDADTCDNSFGACSADLSTCNASLDTCNADLTSTQSDLAACENPACGDNYRAPAEVCDGTDLHGETCATQAPSTPYGTLACNGTCTGFDTSHCRPRWVDNGDGTVSDNQTKLMWEQKTINDGTVHDWNQTYSWSTDGLTPGGTLYTNFLAGLNNCTSSVLANTTGGFAGHCDWRIPTVAELQTLLLAPYPCATHPCIDRTFSDFTQSGYYWPSTALQNVPSGAWLVDFDAGSLATNNKGASYYARGVRGGS